MSRSQNLDTEEPAADFRRRCRRRPRPQRAAVEGDRQPRLGQLRAHARARDHHRDRALARVRAGAPRRRPGAGTSGSPHGPPRQGHLAPLPRAARHPRPLEAPLREGSDEVRHILRAPAPAPLTEGAELRCSRTPSTRGSWRIGWASTMPGRWNITSSRSTPLLRPRCSSPQPRSGPSASGSVTGSCSCRRLQRPARIAEASPRWTGLPRACGLGHRRVGLARGAGGLRHRAETAARMWRETVEQVANMMVMDPYPASG